MSQNIAFSGPFTKAIYTSLYATGSGRQENHPLYGTDFAVVVPSPYRRVNTIIQNQGTDAVNVCLDPQNSLIFGSPAIKLYVGQTMTLDNYNGPIFIISEGESQVVTISESFA